MKKIWCMLLMICSVCAFSACSDDDDKQKDIAGGDKECPVTEIKMPDSAETGETVTITGKGFVTTAKLTLQNENKENLELGATFTTTEGTFTIPVNFEAGKYKVVLTQAGGKWVIGSIEIIVLKRELRVKQIVTNNGSSVVT